VGEGTRVKLDGRNEENPRGQVIRASGRGEGRGWQQNLSRGGGSSNQYLTPQIWITMQMMVWHNHLNSEPGSTSAKFQHLLLKKRGPCTCQTV